MMTMEPRRLNMNDPNLQNFPSELVDIRSFENSGDLQLINGYGENIFRIAGERYTGSIMLIPRQTFSWKPPVNITDLTLDHILPHLGKALPPLFILGVGGAPIAPLNELAISLKNVNIALELMSTAAACRTWNVLMSEGRDAAAGLYAVA